ncbi:T9SS type A sorting domain-containing protein [Paludibacteraceae bacterium OttesenSCG-928-F17]|nr:T9SS type A sorting domain-containing protein [Paludibacteraceae bacterium OttesenSCG-928-F17]
MKNFFGLFILLLLGINWGSAQDFTTEGKDFWLAFGQNSKAEAIINYPNYHNVDLKIRFVAVEDGTVTFTFTQTGSNEGLTPMQVEAGKLYTIKLSGPQAELVYSNRPKSVGLGTIHKGKNQHSLHIESTAPISLYAMNYCNYVADATNVIPTKNLGTNYYHLSYNPYNPTTNDYQDTGFDGYLIIATEDNTHVYNKENTLLETLNKGEVYYYYERVDLTGTYIRSDKPISYFVVTTNTQVPSNYQSTDNLFQQLFPLSTWGTEFLVPNTHRTRDRIRVMASMSNTTITYVGATRKGGSNESGNTLNAGEYIELELDRANNTSGCYISSGAKPIAVTSYLVSNKYNSEGGTNAGDPAMVWIPSLQQNVKSTTIAPFQLSEVIGHNAVIITKKSSKAETVVIKEGTDEIVVLNPDLWVDNSNSNYSFYDLALGADALATSAYTFINEDGLTVLMYGYGNSVSYYYLAGSSVRILNPHFLVNDIHHQEVNGMEFCEGDFTFDGEIFSVYSEAPENIKWFINDAEEGKQRGNKEPWTKYLAEGTYTVRMEVKNSYGLTDICTTTFTVVDCTPKWIGGGRWDNPNGTIINDGNKNRWSIAENWLNKTMPTKNDRVKYHSLAIDLHADSDGQNERPDIYEIKGIDNATAANLIIPADCALKITDVTSYLNFTSTAKVYVESGKPEVADGNLRKNGSFILPKGAVTKKVLTELYVHSPSPFGERDGDKLTWQYFGLPLYGFEPKNLHGAFVRYYDSKQGHPTDSSLDDLTFWHNITNSSPALTPGTGYEIAVWEGNTQAYWFEGELRPIDIQVSLQNTSTAQNKYFAGQNVVANPYTAGLDVATGLEFGEGLQHTVYIFNSGTIGQWDSKISNQEGTAAGQYLAVPSETAGNGYLIPSLQGFVVKFNENLTQNPSAPAQAQLYFRYAGVSKNNQIQRSARKNKQSKTTVSLYSKKELKDRMWLYTDEDATYGFDDGYDGEKWIASNKLSQLYVKRSDGIYQVNAVPNINNTQIMFKPEEGVKEYTLTFRHENLEEFYEKIYLIDLFNRITIDITADNSQYSFTTANISSAENQFMIISNKSDEIINDDNKFEVFHNSDAIVFYNRTNEPMNCLIYNTSGQLVHSLSVDNHTPACLNKSFSNGTYLIEAISSSHKITKKFIMQ